MDNLPVTITAVDSDPGGLLALRYEWLRCTTRDEEFESRLRDWWAAERHHRWALVAETSDGEPVGMANALVYTRMPSPGQPTARWLYSANVYVSPVFRRRGIVTALMARLIGDAREEGMERVVLAPSEMSKPMYRSLGFREADDLMRLDLGVPQRL
ncbi:GNAT family N-acetyltransferase [Dermacoccus abyssi]|uniref:GNAT family N-acetyltransferase n=1 Tax=Dermacoccus abyssi TaxID=322596 RepID=UPI0021A76789|nr:GNAT family N-acetyltransferase [Dermacoccus abyssi]MCT1986252.1 GNAT family N-acetyltransferase [Dermacoccus abyssi]